ncbi:MAG: DUF1403 family protein [Rhizobiaceae bacterium]
MCHAGRLLAVAPELSCKGADGTVLKLISKIAGPGWSASDRFSRRRLVSLSVVRELPYRPTFRLHEF